MDLSGFRQNTRVVYVLTASVEELTTAKLTQRVAKTASVYRRADRDGKTDTTSTIKTVIVGELTTAKLTQRVAKTASVYRRADRSKTYTTSSEDS